MFPRWVDIILRPCHFMYDIKCSKFYFFLLLMHNASLLPISIGWWTLCTQTHFTFWQHFALLTFAQKNSLLQIGLLQFTPQHTLPHRMFSCLEHFALQPPLLPRTLDSSAQFASQHPLLHSTLCTLEHFSSWNTLLLGTLCSPTPFAF